MLWQNTGRYVRNQPVSYTHLMITGRKKDSLMIRKIKKGRSFGGCIRYVTQKDDAEIIASEGVLLGTAEEMARSFRWQCLLNPDVAKPVGHIALSFKPEDSPRLTDAFMACLLYTSFGCITTKLYFCKK